MISPILDQMKNSIRDPPAFLKNYCKLLGTKREIAFSVHLKLLLLLRRNFMCKNYVNISVYIGGKNYGCEKNCITKKTPLRLYLDRRPSGPGDTAETVATASPTHCWANRTLFRVCGVVCAGPPASSSGSLMPPAFWLIVHGTHTQKKN